MSPEQKSTFAAHLIGSGIATALIYAVTGPSWWLLLGPVIGAPLGEIGLAAEEGFAQGYAKGVSGG